MRKLVLFTFLLFGFVVGAFAQIKLGLKFSPSFTSSRINLISDTLDIENASTNTKFSLGLVMDSPLTDTYFFSTGLFYVPRRFSLNIIGENGGSFKNPREAYDLQYLQVPLTLKLFTNEIMPDMSMYFQVGATAEFLIYHGPVQEEYTLINELKGIDSSVIFGGGMEYQAGLNTVIFGGISYQRGLINIVKTTEPALADGFAIRTSALMVDIGLKF
ncbi:MAG: PorT family protein [Cyclobacteriaceae bacterium]|nr:PorT family protein [Cyclobacteriaceae bacterium]